MEKTPSSRVGSAAAAAVIAGAIAVLSSCTVGVPATTVNQDDPTPEDTVGGVFWTWVSGSDVSGQASSYGVQGTASASNVIGARNGSIGWADDSGNLWVFGGYGSDGTGAGGYLNDLWRFDGSVWTWIGGKNACNSGGVAGDQGTADGTYAPGGRANAGSGTDSHGNLWLFGGRGCDCSHGLGYLSDLWRFDGVNWSWISGSKTNNQSGNYGNKGQAAASNVPGTRDAPKVWVDGAGNVWVFGGFGLDSTGNFGYLNDLWRFDGENWTWISGSDTVGAAGVYGTLNVAADDNVPGARSDEVGWIDENGNLWVFGGLGYDGNGAFGRLNDLWKFDGSRWTWVSGGGRVNEWGVYGTKGVTEDGNSPGARYTGVGWSDDRGLWIFGGIGYDAQGNLSALNDLWLFDGTRWTWMSGGKTADCIGVYGTQGTADAGNMPGARYCSASIQGTGGPWLFAGNGLDNGATAGGPLNDLWRFELK